MTNIPYSHRLGIYLIYALVFFLPLFEAPKNITVAALLLWATASLWGTNWGGGWSKWDTSIFLVILAGFASEPPPKFRFPVGGV